MERLGTSPGETLYIGDRADVDAALAQAAGVRCALITNRRLATGHRPPAICARTFEDLQRLLWA
jgi:FMN phosphatase YigB (HAD superfamily)